jgi:hypothetical protein
VLLADFEEVTAGLARWEDWCAAWCARAKVHEDLGREALGEGYSLTAGEHLTRAAMYYHFAKFVFVHDQDQMRAAHRRSVECYEAALPLMRPPGERVAIPFERGTLYGVLRHPLERVARPPVLIMAPGLLRGAVPRAGDRDSRHRRSRTGRSRIRDPDRGRLRARCARRMRLDRRALRSGFGADRHVGGEPRRLLRAAGHAKTGSCRRRTPSGSRRAFRGGSSC